ncbi:molybdenum cofactor biosynthesis protein, partial [Pseudomonas aeruginosa]
KTHTSGQTHADALLAAGHRLHHRSRDTDGVYRICVVVSAWIDYLEVEVVLYAGGTGLTDRIRQPQALCARFRRVFEVSAER